MMSKAKSKAAGPRVYSYIRFSTPDQLKGDSLRRQLKMSQDWCDRNGCVLDTSFKLHDLGVSAFRSKNATHGRFAGFLKAVDEGEIPPGSILLVESLDRLSRDQIGAALEQFLGILRRDVKIVTLNPEETFSKESINDLVKIIVALVIMSRAYEESATKSKRIRASRDTAREQARDELKVLTSRAPLWLRTVTDKAKKEKSFELIPEAAKTIRLIFDLKAEGVGTGTIEKRLNAEACWTPPKNKKRKNSGWAASYIKKILQNRAVIGEYQPHKKVDGRRFPVGEPIPGYYPPVVDPEIFHAVQERLNANRGKGGRRGKVTNLFSHLVKCAYCQGSMIMQDKGKPPKGAKYLVCYAGKRGAGCKSHRIRYDECEDTILANCHKLRPEQVLPNPNERSKRSLALRLRIQAKVGELKQIEGQISNLTDTIARTESQAARDRYDAKLVQLEARKVELHGQHAQDEAELLRVEQGLESFTAWKQNLDTLRLAISADNPEVRQRLQAHLRDIISSIEIFAEGHQHEHDSEAGGEDFYEKVMGGLDNREYRAASRDKKFQAFLRYVESRRMSKEGRFLRVQFKTGMTIDVVPEGSLASGVTLRRKERGTHGWKFVSPKTATLWNQFESSGLVTPHKVGKMPALKSTGGKRKAAAG